MAGMWDRQVKLRCFTKKLYCFVVGQVLFKKNILLRVSYLSVCIYCIVKAHAEKG